MLKWNLKYYLKSLSDFELWGVGGFYTSEMPETTFCTRFFLLMSWWLMKNFHQDWNNDRWIRHILYLQSNHWISRIEFQYRSRVFGRPAPWLWVHQDIETSPCCICWRGRWWWRGIPRWRNRRQPAWALCVGGSAVDKHGTRSDDKNGKKYKAKIPDHISCFLWIQFCYKYQVTNTNTITKYTARRLNFGTLQLLFSKNVWSMLYKSWLHKFAAPDILLDCTTGSGYKTYQIITRIAIFHKDPSL